jgi:hypothetical protein
MKQGISILSFRIAARCAPLAIAALAGVALVEDVVRPPVLHAASVTDDDADHDGLCDRFEKVLGTYLFLTDSDQDGFTDAEEFARQWLPGDGTQGTLSNQHVQVSFGAYGGDGMVHLVIGVYSLDATQHDKIFEIGKITRDVLEALPTQQWLANATWNVIPGAAPGSTVSLIDIPISPRLVRNWQDASLYVTLRIQAAGTVAAADSIRLRYIDGVVVLVKQELFTGGATTAALTAGPHTAAAPRQGSGTFVPLPLSGDDLPGSWTPGAICFQTTVPVSAQGAMITQEVISADCQAGFDGACPPSCLASTGSTFTTVDPVVLIGG